MAEKKMPEMITLTIGGTTYEIVDELARDRIGNLNELHTDDKTCVIAALNELVRKLGAIEVDEATVKEIVEDCLDDAGVEKFATKDEVEAKADDVLFPEDYRVGAAFGGFNVGDSLQGMMLREIIAKLLDAELYVSVIEKITGNEIPMLSGSPDSLEKTSYSLITMTAGEAAGAPTASGFYQITENGAVIESGYQLSTESTGRKNYAMALPEGATIISVSMWDALTQSWLPYSPVFTPTGTMTVDGYSYTTYESDDSSSGEVLRIVIE